MLVGRSLLGADAVIRWGRVTLTVEGHGLEKGGGEWDFF
jgi:hypothetical protein